MRDGITGRVDEGVDACSGSLVVGTADFEVVGGDNVVGCGDVGVEVGFGDIFGEGLAFLLGEWLVLSLGAGSRGELTMYCEDGGEDWLGFVIGKRRASEEGMQEGPVGVVVGYFIVVRHC